MFVLLKKRLYLGCSLLKFNNLGQFLITERKVKQYHFSKQLSFSVC